MILRVRCGVTVVMYIALECCVPPTKKPPRLPGAAFSNPSGKGRKGYAAFLKLSTATLTRFEIGWITSLASLRKASLFFEV